MWKARFGLIPNVASLSPSGGGGGASPAIVWAASPAGYNDGNSVNPSTHTFTSVAIGTASSDRIIAVGVGHSGTALVSAVVVGGVSATQAVQTTGPDATSIWYAAVPTGTTANIDVTTAGGFSMEKIVIGVSALTGVTATPTATASVNKTFSDPAVAITIPSGGIGMVFGFGQWTSYTFTNATKDGEGTITGSSGAVGHLSASATVTMGNTAGNGAALAIAAWGA